MGNRLFGAVENLAHDSIYQPPSVNYMRSSCQFARTKDGDSIAMRLYSPNAEVERRFRSSEKAASPYDLLLLSHGNGTDIGRMHRFCEHLSTALQMDVVVYDYPEYGHSSGEHASESKLLASIEAVFEACMDNAWKQKRTFLVGHSLGSVPTIYLASQPGCGVCGVVLLAPLASASRVLLQDSKYVPRWLLRQLDCVLFDNVHRIADVTCMVAIVHGTGDTVVTVEHTEQLKLKIREGCRYTTLFLPTGHNELVDVSSREMLKITEYIRKFCRKCSTDSSTCAPTVECFD
jgi:alpha-beta hydrolase superfamily lysophospholipase